VNINYRSSNPEQAEQGGTSNRLTVREGDQKSREEECGAADNKASGTAAGKGAGKALRRSAESPMNPPFVDRPHPRP